MTSKKIVALLFVISWSTGCSPLPFQETSHDHLSAASPRDLVQRFAASQALRFQLLNSIVFEYNWQAFSGIGYLNVDRDSGRFKVACLNTLGVKLFELSGDGDQVTDLYTIPAFSRFGSVTAAVGADIRRMYLNIVPSANAEIWWRSDSAVRLREPSPEGTIEYVFAGPDGDVVEKNCYKENGLAWRASYYEYREEGGKRFPRGIVFQNFDYHYRLIVRQRELIRENDQTGN
ncbi:MAG TPA: hypothetical protein VK654_05450 [Nitrospirota bacterium]|nr:hypothetical protein [Nitrospirota bacterium]